MSKRTLNPDDFNWLTKQDEGKKVLVTGHWVGDFTGRVKYGGAALAIITDSDGNDREIVYVNPVKFKLL